MGLDWKGQHAKIMAHPVLSKGMEIITIPSAGGLQEMVCLPLPLLPGWQMTINANKVAPELRENVIVWQTEASLVLFRHFFGRPTPGAIDSAVLDRLAALEKKLDTAIQGYDERQGIVIDWFTMFDIVVDQGVISDEGRRPPTTGRVARSACSATTSSSSAMAARRSTRPTCCCAVAAAIRPRRSLSGHAARRADLAPGPAYGTTRIARAWRHATSRGRGSNPHVD
jgi:hypothetical protein